MNLTVKNKHVTYQLTIKYQIQQKQMCSSILKWSTLDKYQRLRAQCCNAVSEKFL